LADDLLSSAKEKDEHDAIVAEVKNSMSDITDAVKISDKARIVKTSYAQHISTSVKGELKEGCTWGDILMNTFPPVAISGVPKKAAMKVISGIEGDGRDFYGGAVGWIEGDSADFAAIIRTFIKDGNISKLQVGSKVSVGSVVEEEVEEILHKARKVLEVLE